MSLTPQIKRYVARQLQGGGGEEAAPSPWVISGGDLSYTQGNVGIGISPPAYQLDVGGDLNITGVYRIGGTTVLTASSLGSGVTSSSLTSVGTIGTGVWQGTAIANAYIATGLDVTKLTVGTTLPSNVVTSSLTAVGTIATGVWQGTAIANAYIATGLDVAKLTVGTTLPANIVTSSLTSVGTLTNLTVTNPISGSVTGTAANVTGTVAIANGGTGATGYASYSGIALESGDGILLETSTIGSPEYLWLETSDDPKVLVYRPTTNSFDVIKPGDSGQYLQYLNEDVVWSSPSFLPLAGGTMTGSIVFAGGQSWPTFNQNTTGNAATATALQTARTINGVSFDGTANITVAAAAGTLTGSSLASGVTASSLTSVGTLTGLTVARGSTGVVASFGVSGATNNPKIEITPDESNNQILVDAPKYTFRTSATGRLEIGDGGTYIYNNAYLQASVYSTGIYTTTVGATNRDVFVDNTGLVGYVASIQAAKSNITSLTDVPWLLSLRPVAFNYRKKDATGAYSEETEDAMNYGLIAEEVEAVNPSLCFYDTVDGLPELRGVSYSKLIVPMLRHIQALESRLSAIEEAQ